MNQLTDEQIRKIEENRRAAELRKLTACQILPNAAKSSFPTNQNHRKRPISTTNFFNSKINQNLAKVKIEFAVLQVIADDKIFCDMSYHAASIELMKTIPGRSFDKVTKKWTFPLSEHDNLVNKLSGLKGEVQVAPVPKSILNALKIPFPSHNVDISKIDNVLLHSLLPFQAEGVKFGVSRKGRCLIADDMGLGKTIQALGVAHYFVEKWPLLIVCPSSMRFPWEEAIHRFLPSVNPFYVSVMTKAHDVIHEANVVILSYDLLKTSLNVLKQKKFGVIIFDESHFLKNWKSARTKAALELSPRAQHVILLSGTPALSRPQELYPQIHVIDPTCFRSFHEFGERYCAAKKNAYGWDYSGSSHTAELEIFIKRKFLLRRLKADVLAELPSKFRKVVYLQTKISTAISSEMQVLATQMERQRGLEKRGTLMQFYCATGAAKLPAIQEYLTDKLECPGKMLIFAHHTHVLDGLCELLIDQHVDHIRIDGSTPAEARAQLCERFQTVQDTRVAVLSIKAANSGITLTAAQFVLFAELFWNPGELTQAEDRAHRIGQRDCVNVEYLLARGTADDYLWSLVQSKLHVLNSVGLSKDSFKDANREEVPDKYQPTLPELFEKNKPDSTGNSFQVQSDIEDLFQADFDSMADAFQDDEVFDSLDLNDIDEQYCSEIKKAKLAL